MIRWFTLNKLRTLMHMSTVPNIVENNNYMFGKKKTLPWQMIYKLFFFFFFLCTPQLQTFAIQNCQCTDLGNSKLFCLQMIEEFSSSICKGFCNWEFSGTGTGNTSWSCFNRSESLRWTTLLNRVSLAQWNCSPDARHMSEQIRILYKQLHVSNSWRCITINSENR